MSDLQEVGKLRRAMMPLFKMLPDSLIEANEKRFGLLEKKLEELSMQKPEVVVNVPEITVPELKVPTPNVVVKTDLTEVVNQLAELGSELKKVKENKEVTSDYQPHDQAKSQTYQYSGFIRMDGSWYIQRVAKGEQRYAKGSGDYADAWERRSKLKYGFIDA